MTGGDDSAVGELLLPPDLSPEAVRPLPGARTVHLAGETMGTVWSLAAAIPPAIAESAIRATLEHGFARVIAQMSQWEPDSEISRFNRAAPATQVPLSAEFAHVLDCALTIARASEGAFDPALGAASELWGFGAGPAPARVPEAGPRGGPGWRDLALDPTGRVALQPGGLRLDLSGIAKGFAVDHGIRQLEGMGIRHALLDIGGELRGAGVRADGLPWWVDAEIPPGSTAPLARIGLSGWAIATSGNYRRRREAEGHSWSHSLDPASGAPLGDDVLAATALHRGCMQADALATAILVLGPERGLAFADRYGVPARIVTREATVASRAWQAWAREPGAG